MTAVIALLFDLSLWLLGRQLTPWRRSPRLTTEVVAHG
jgi:hypothetical protein